MSTNVGGAGRDVGMRGGVRGGVRSPVRGRDRVRRVRGVARGAFTLVEMLVIVAIAVILVIIALPAFRAMLSSAEQVQAEESLKAALQQARDVAVRAGFGEDAAAVFTYEPPVAGGSGRLRVFAASRVGVMTDVVNGDEGLAVRREVFVAAEGLEAVSLPPGYSVRGYVPAGVIGTDWYEVLGGSVRYPAGQAAWVFPESDFFDATLTDATGGLARQTFIVRFTGGTGTLSPVQDDVLVVSPRNSGLNRETTPASLRVDRAEDLRRWANRVLATPDVDGDGDADVTDDRLRRTLLGDASGDTVLARPVTQLAMYEEEQLAAALGVRLDPDTRTIYAGPPRAASETAQPRPWLPRLVDGTAVTSENITRWVQGNTNLNTRYPPADVEDQPVARVFTVDRFLGGVREIALQTGEVRQ